MRVHDVCAGGRATHHLGSFSDALRTEQAIGLQVQGHALERPVTQVLGGIAGEADEHVSIVGLVLAEQVEDVAVLNQAGAVRIHNATVGIEPWNTIVNV